LQHFNCHLALLDLEIYNHTEANLEMEASQKQRGSQSNSKINGNASEKTIVIKADSENTNVMSISCNKTQKQT
jgi:hypothetical protein